MLAFGGARKSTSLTLKLKFAAKFHYASWFGAGSEPASVMEFGTNQLRTMFGASSELASLMEFGFIQAPCCAETWTEPDETRGAIGWTAGCNVNIHTCWQIQQRVNELLLILWVLNIKITATNRRLEVLFIWQTQVQANVHDEIASVQQQSNSQAFIRWK